MPSKHFTFRPFRMVDPNMTDHLAGPADPRLADDLRPQIHQRQDAGRVAPSEREDRRLLRETRRQGLQLVSGGAQTSEAYGGDPALSLCGLLPTFFVTPQGFGKWPRCTGPSRARAKGTWREHEVRMML